jgi:lipoprotein-anchoring transpeptidase ErfK/SrfK
MARSRSILTTALSALVVLPVGLSAQAIDLGLAGPGGGALSFESRILEKEVVAALPLVDHVDRYIVVHLAENRVYLFEGNRSIWSAPAGTGTGLKLDTREHSWTWETPRGLMQVRRMEKDPIWEASDWYFIEKGLQVPPANDPSRKIPGVMGTGAIYLGDGIAIHGTNTPQLLMDPDPKKRNVSHGCIRLTNEAVRELMHMVSVGTPVLIF